MLLEYTFTIIHKSGTSNKAADALSHRVNLMSAMKNVVLGFEELPRELREDAELGPIIKGMEAKTRHDYLLHDGYLFFENLLCIPNTSILDCSRAPQTMSFWCQEDTPSGSRKIFSAKHIERHQAIHEAMPNLPSCQRNQHQPRTVHTFSRSNRTMTSHLDGLC
jgi:hypothetical protein